MYSDQLPNCLLWSYKKNLVCRNCGTAFIIPLATDADMRDTETYNKYLLGTTRFVDLVTQ